MVEYELSGVVGEAWRRWPIPEGETKVGRHADLPVSLPDRSVSREHATLSLAGGTLRIRDEQSRNGTTVNGTRIHAWHALRPGDQIAFGNVTLTLNGEAPTLQPQLSPPERIDSTMKLAWNDVRKTPGGEVSGSRPQMFELISELGEFLVQHQKLQEVYEACLDAVEKVVPFQRACLLLLENGEPVLKAGRYKVPTGNQALAFSRTMLDNVIHERASLLVQDAMADPRFNVAQSVILEQIRSALIVPLFDNTNVIGVLYADTRELVSPYREEHLRQLAMLANVLAVKISNSRLLEAKREQERLIGEMETARQMQRKLLVQDLPCPEGYEICARLEPSTEVGGDLYDVGDLGGGRYAIVLGDVVGHGVGAALLMANALAAVRALYGVAGGPSALVDKVHRMIYETTDPTSYLTLVVGVLDVSTHSIEWVNAGHQEAPAVVLPGGEVVRLDTTGPPVGLLPIARFESSRLELPPGSLLCMWSDGIPEAHPPAGEDEPPPFFGDSVSMLEMISGPPRPLAALANEIFDRVDAFLGGINAPDDRTLLLLRRHR
jgi:serine phosphatase RsbU (regulator of sigma subunit)